MTTWQTFKEFINSVPIGHPITRTILKVKVDESPSRPTTVDTYRRMCEVAGYLKKSSRPGIYIKAKDIPVNAGKNDIKEEAYGYRNCKRRNYLNAYDKIQNLEW